MSHVHDDCGGAVIFVNDRTAPPPEPDLWGTYRVLYECQACGERFTILFPAHGGEISPPDLTSVDDLGADPEPTDN